MENDKFPYLKDIEDFEVPNTASNITDAKEYYNSYKKFIEYFNLLPKTELINRGWIKSKDDISSLIPLFQSIHLNKFVQLFRKSDTSNSALCAVWLSQVSTKAKLKCSVSGSTIFNGIDKNFLRDIAKLSSNENSVFELPDILLKAGIVLIYEKALKGMKLDGAVFALESNVPVIGISFRYPRLDHFWFTLLHELAHICLHYEQLIVPILDDFDFQDNDTREIAANRMANQSFIEKSLWRNCKAKYTRAESDVTDFANQIGVHPSIVAGRLQRELNSYSIFRNLVDEVNIRERIFSDG